MTSHPSGPILPPQLPPDAALWVGICVAGVGLTALFGIVDIVWPQAWCTSALHDAGLLGFALPALGALGLWVKAFYDAPSARTRDAASEAAQLMAALYSVAAFGIAFAQGFVGKPWLLGRLPLSASLALGVAALSPMFVWRVRPQWLRRERQR